MHAHPIMCVRYYPLPDLPSRAPAQQIRAAPQRPVVEEVVEENVARIARRKVARLSEMLVGAMVTADKHRLGKLAFYH